MLCGAFLFAHCDRKKTTNRSLRSTCVCAAKGHVKLSYSHTATERIEVLATGSEDLPLERQPLANFVCLLIRLCATCVYTEHSDLRSIQAACSLKSVCHCDSIFLLPCKICVLRCVFTNWCPDFRWHMCDRGRLLSELRLCFAESTP